MEYIQADIWVRFQRMQGHAGALRRRRRRARRADHAEGRGRRHHARGAGRAHRRRAAAVPRRASTSASTTGTRRTRRRTSSCRPDIYRKLKAAGLIYVQAGRAVLRSGEEDVPARTATSRASARTATRRISTAMPARVCGSVYSPTDLINPYSTLSGATPVRKTSDHYFFRLSDPKCVEFLKSWLDAPGRLQPSVANKAREWLTRQRRSGARRLGHLARRALLRHPDSGRARQVSSTCGWTRRSAISPR